MIFKFCVVVFVFSVYLPIYEVNSYDELQFWQRDPKFDARRNHEVRRNPNTKEHNQKTKEGRGKTNLKSPQEKVKPVGSSLNNNTKRHREKMVLPSNFSYMSKPRFRAQEEIKKNVSNKPKILSTKESNLASQMSKAVLRSKKGKKETKLRSTRIIPEDQAIKPKQKVWAFSDTNNGTENRYRLSPYSIAQQLEHLTSGIPNANISSEVIGRTAEYNDIILLKVSEVKRDTDKYFRADDSKYVDDASEKKIVFIVHALSVMGIKSMSVFKYSHYTRKLLSYYFAHLDKFDIFLIPMANPDGFSFALTETESYVPKIWNKNMSPQAVCAGVALDRNFDVAWNTTKEISSCSQQYPGDSPFSEPETRAIRDVFHRYSHKIVAYMHLHPGTYDFTTFKGDAVLYPKGYTDLQSDDDKYMDLKGDIEEAMKNASFKYMTVTVDTLYNWYGPVFGSSVDYASMVYGIPYAMELVMQIYKNEYPVSTEEDLENNALEEIWGRVIDVILKSIWKSLTANDV